MASTIVVGHRNPDNDSICSAVAYAYLKNIIDPENEYVPARLGPMPDETSWVFQKFAIEAPAVVPHVFSRVCDAMTADVISIQENATMLEAGIVLRNHNIRALVVNDAQGKYVGLITTRTLADLYIAETDVADTCTTTVQLGNLVKSFAGELVLGDPERILDGHLRVAASEPATFAESVMVGDTVVVGDRKRTQPIALEKGASCLILSCGARPSGELLSLAEQKGAAIACSAHDTYTTTRFATLAQTIDAYVDTGALTLNADTLLKEATEDLLASPLREAVVLDDEGFCIGIITRSDIAVTPRRRVVLVDHNETSQAVRGIKEAEVVDIVDHHRVGDIQTAGPIQFLNLPLGSTATIITREFQRHGIVIPIPIAAALLSAIMTDTVLLKSPTATSVDREMADYLGGVIGSDPLEFGLELFRRRGAEQALTIESIVSADSKEFELGDARIMIAQHETVDLAAVLEREDELQAYLNDLSTTKGYQFSLLLVTDVLAEGSQFILAGNPRIAERAFDISFAEGSVWIPGILSRKKQVAARLFEQGV